MGGKRLTETIFAGGALVIALVVALVVLRRSARESEMPPAPVTPPGATTESRPGFIYGRIMTKDGTIYEGRLRWRGDEEAFWDDYFDGAKDANQWAVHSPERRAKEHVEIFGFKVGDRDRDRLDRPFMARFGDIARVAALNLRQVRVTLKSGTMVVLDRFEAGDIDDGVRVWDSRRGVVDVDDGDISTIEFLPTAPIAAPPARLHGTVRTRQGDFSGFIQWHRRDSVGTDELDGRIDGREVRVRYDSIRAIARRPGDRESILVTRIDGSEMVLSGTPEAGRGNRGVCVDDARYGRVVIPWDRFERVEFDAVAGSGSAYGDFAPGRPLSGSIATRDGRVLTGRLVYDFDESETVETLDGGSPDAEYSIPFGAIASILPGRDAGDEQRATVVLRNGEVLKLDRAGDLGPGNAGMLIFVDGRGQPEYVPWMEVEKVDFAPLTSASGPRAR